jgi:hypothetical protein
MKKLYFILNVFNNDILYLLFNNDKVINIIINSLIFQIQ